MPKTRTGAELAIPGDGCLGGPAGMEVRQNLEKIDFLGVPPGPGICAAAQNDTCTPKQVGCEKVSLRVPLISPDFRSQMREGLLQTQMYPTHALPRTPPGAGVLCTLGAQHDEDAGPSNPAEAAAKDVIEDTEAIEGARRPQRFAGGGVGGIGAWPLGVTAVPASGPRP
eukprot:gene14784-biopygen17127